MRERAELMGSQLQIESRQGEGTRILLRLPESVR
jgi:signal transduction histidine kinase